MTLINLLLAALISSAAAFEVEIEDSDGDTINAIVTVKNDCGKTHKLVVSKQDIGKVVVSDWVTTVMAICDNKETTQNAKRSKSFN